MNRYDAIARITETPASEWVSEYTETGAYTENRRARLFVSVDQAGWVNVGNVYYTDGHGAYIVYAEWRAGRDCKEAIQNLSEHHGIDLWQEVR